MTHGPDNPTRTRGTALPMVLFFAVFGFIAATVYVLAQMHMHKPVLEGPARLQALLNARSGAWAGLSLVNSAEIEDTAADARRIDSAFGMGMFEAGRTADDDSAPAVGMDTLTIDPFGDSVYGLCRISLAARGGFRILHSTGAYRGFEQSMSAVLGSRPFLSPDTVLFLETPGMPEGGGAINGRVHFLPVTVDSAIGRKERGRFTVFRSDVDTFVNEYLGTLVETFDTVMLERPHIVKSGADLAEVGDTVKGPLFIDGTFRDIEWRGRQRRIRIMGDLQFTGEVDIRAAEFIVAGEIRVFDRANLSAVVLFSQRRIFFADDAVFRGQAVALEDIEIYGNAVIEDRSAVITVGKSRERAGGEARPAPQKQAADTAEAQPVQEAKGTKKYFSLFVRDRAQVDGVLINLNASAGIQTDIETEITGVLWAEGRICHQGRLWGVIKAGTLVAIDDPQNLTANIMAGSVGGLENIAAYYLPYFIGELSIVSWKEH